MSDEFYSNIVFLFLFIFYSDTINNTFVAFDVCGSTLAESVTSAPPQSSGYITSPNYPNNYPPYTKCSCQLSADNGTVINLELLDFDLVQFPNDAVPYDWLEYLTPGVSDWGSGEKLNFQTGVILANSQNIAVNFNTNDDSAGRGFWIQYSSLCSSRL